MSGAAEGIAGLALSAVSVAALFTTCIDCYSLVVAAREFGEDYELLCTELSLQKLRFFLWGESVGLASRTPDAQPRPNPGLDDPVIQPTVIRTLNAIKNLLSETQEFDIRYGFKAEESSNESSSRGLSIFRGTFDQFKIHSRRNQAQKSVATVTRWAIFDADNFEVKITRLKGFIDGLESITRSLVTLDAQHSRLRAEIESISDVESLLLLSEISDSDAQDVSDTASRRLSHLGVRISLETTSTSNQTFYSAQSRMSREVIPRGGSEDLVIVMEQDRLENGSSQTETSGSESILRARKREPRESRRNRILRRITPARTTRITGQDTRPHPPQQPGRIEKLYDTERPSLYKLVVLGDKGVGKTVFKIQFTVEKFVEGYDHIFEHSYRKIAEIDGVRCLVEVLDTAGQEEYTALRDQWIRDGEGFVILYGIGNRSSFTRAQRFHSQIARVKQSADSFEIQLGQISQRKTPIILVGHNYAKGSGQVDREVSAAEGLSLSRELECDFMEVSAKNGTNVKKVIIDLVRMIRRQREAAMGARLQLQPIME